MVIKPPYLTSLYATNSSSLCHYTFLLHLIIRVFRIIRQCKDHRNQVSHPRYTHIPVNQHDLSSSIKVSVYSPCNIYFLRLVNFLSSNNLFLIFSKKQSWPQYGLNSSFYSHLQCHTITSQSLYLSSQWASQQL